MNWKWKFVILLPIVTLMVLATGCTPEQIRSIEQHYQIDIAPEAETWAIAQEDGPIKMQDGTVFEVDGTVTPPQGLDAAIALAQFGVCDSWRPVYDWFALHAKNPPSWEWFRKVLKRESGCGWDTYNERTGDSGPLQINPIHKKWIKAELGYDFRMIRQWKPGIEAALALWNKTGRCNWDPNGFCS